MSGSFSASVIRGKTTYIFYNGKTDDGTRVIKLMKVVGEEATTQTLRVDGQNVPASEGPIAATTVADWDGIRLYIVTKKSVVEYGLDTKIGEFDKWKKEAFTSSIALEQNSFLNALGKPELGTTVNENGKQVRLRLYYSKAGAGAQITEQTYTDQEGWQEKTISS